MPPAHFDPARITALAHAALDLERHPGFRHFTTGLVTGRAGPSGHWTLTTDHEAAAGAVTTALHRHGYAVEHDRPGGSREVTVWPVHAARWSPLPALTLHEEIRVHRGVELGSGTWVLDGPLGTVEQQYGSGGHNDLLVHALHPFGFAARWTACPRHPGGCWLRTDWRLPVRARSLLTPAPICGRPQPTPQLAVRLRTLYRMHVHATAPLSALPAPSGTPSARSLPGRNCS
ncbi:hypothetical protein ACFXPX_38525 [Kitasatospora sp. NPDC059146]|uniref:hypothetical protein n=1 Tax=unclassified Kitasatospora TaxID=2633591 RepID=UPI0036C89B5A